MKDKSKAFADPTEFNRELDINGQRYNIKLADTPVTKKRGLMYNSTLKDDQGLLLLFSEEEASIWMYNTPLPLTVLWFDDKKRLIDISNAEPCMTKPCEDYRPKAPAKYALEVKQGTFRGKIGDFFFMVGGENDFISKKPKKREDSRLDAAIYRTIESQVFARKLLR